MTSVRLFLRRGQQLDLRIEKISERDCCLTVEPDPGSHGGVIVDLAIQAGSEALNDQREVDDAVQLPAAAEQIGEHYRHIIGIGNQVGCDPALFTADHNQTSAAGVDFTNFATNQQSGAAFRKSSEAA